MKKTVLIVIIGVLISNYTYSQSDRMIEYKKSFGGYKYTQNGELLNMNQMVSIISSVPEASTYIKKSKTNNSVSMVFSGVGGFMIGWPLGTAIGGGEPEWGMMAIGGALVLAGIPFIVATNKNAKKAVDIYNSNYQNSYYKSPRLEFGLNPNGIGLALVF